MSENLAAYGNELVDIEGIKIRRDQIDLIKRTVFVNATDDELRLFFYECARRGTHPMDRLIFPVSRKDKEGNRRVTFQAGIDYLRAAAEETGRYVGQKSVEYGGNVKQASEAGEIIVPECATVTVLRRDPESGEVSEIPFTAFWVEYYPGEKLGHMWRKMPHHMLAKCAEAGALRKGFPRKLGGLYINEEMEQADAVPFSSGQRPPIQPPQEKKAAPEAEESVISGVDNVTIAHFKKKDNSQGTKYVIHAGEKYETFSETMATEAKRAKEAGLMVTITYHSDAYGRKLDTLVVQEPPREPGVD